MNYKRQRVEIWQSQDFWPFWPHSIASVAAGRIFNDSSWQNRWLSSALSVFESKQVFAFVPQNMKIPKLENDLSKFKQFFLSSLFQRLVVKQRQKEFSLSKNLIFCLCALTSLNETVHPSRVHSNPFHENHSDTKLMIKWLVKQGIKLRLNDINRICKLRKASKWS